MVVPCMMTMVSKLGGDHQKGSVMGIFRSLGALARAAGPILASIGKYSMSLAYRFRYYQSFIDSRSILEMVIRDNKEFIRVDFQIVMLHDAA